MKIVTQAIPTVLFNDDSKLWLTIQVCRKWRTQNTVYSTSIAMSANETAVWCSVIGHTQSDETNRCTNSSVHIHTVCLCVYVCMWLQRQRQAEEQQQQQQAASLCSVQCKRTFVDNASDDNRINRLLNRLSLFVCLVSDTL